MTALSRREKFCKEFLKRKNPLPKKIVILSTNPNASSIETTFKNSFLDGCEKDGRIWYPEFDKIEETAKIIKWLASGEELKRTHAEFEKMFPLDEHAKLIGELSEYFLIDIGLPVGGPVYTLTL